MSNYIVGQYSYSIDNKGRLIIPPKFRDFLGEVFILTRGLDGCLFAFPENEWIKFQDKLSALPISDIEARRFTRFFFNGATDCNLDKQGRISIPAKLREFAHLDNNAVIVGMNTRIEIWNEDLLNDFSDIDENIAAEGMAKLGI